MFFAEACEADHGKKGRHCHCFSSAALNAKMLETGSILQQETHMIHFEVTEHHS